MACRLHSLLPASAGLVSAVDTPYHHNRPASASAATAPSATRHNRAEGWDRRSHDSVGGPDGGARGVRGTRGGWCCSEGCSPPPVGQSPREAQGGFSFTTDKDIESLSARGSKRAYTDVEEDGCTNDTNAPGQREQQKKRKRLMERFCFLGEVRSPLVLD